MANIEDLLGGSLKDLIEESSGLKARRQEAYTNKLNSLLLTFLVRRGIMTKVEAEAMVALARAHAKELK